jgi:hypothetical protein
MNETDGGIRDGRAIPEAPPPIAVPPPVAAAPTRIAVGGWLKFFVVTHLYISPAFFAIAQIVAWIGFVSVAREYPAIIPIGVIESGVGGFFVFQWIVIAGRLNDRRPRAVQETRRWLLYTLAWGLLSSPLGLLAGMDGAVVAVGAARQVFGSMISFAIWYSYFNVSKRVRATYPDWSD